MPRYRDHYGQAQTGFRSTKVLLACWRHFRAVGLESSIIGRFIIDVYVNASGGMLPAGKTVLIRSLSASQYTGASFWIIGPNGGGAVAANPTLSVPGTFSYRVFDAANTVGNLRWGSVKAVDPSSLVQYATSYIPIRSVASGSPAQPVISVVSQLTVPFGGTAATPVGLNAPNGTTNSYAITASNDVTFAQNDNNVSTLHPLSATIHSQGRIAGSTFTISFF